MSLAVIGVTLFTPTQHTELVGRKSKNFVKKIPFFPEKTDGIVRMRIWNEKIIVAPSSSSSNERMNEQINYKAVSTVNYPNMPLARNEV